MLICDRGVTTFHGGDLYGDEFGDWLSYPSLASEIGSIVVWESFS